MRGLKMLPLDARKLYSDIADAKDEPRRTVLVNLKATIAAAYGDYKSKVPDVDKVSEVELTDEQEEALLHAYGSTTTPMTKAWARLVKRVDASYCPFCNIGGSHTLDHYLPKKTYPAFAVFPANLVPSCGECNSKKLERVLDEKTSVRAFFHPYFDAIPTQPFLAITTKMRGRTLQVRYRLRKAGMSVQQFNQLKSHFERMELADKFRRRALSHLGSRYGALARWYAEGGAAEVAKQLKQEADDLAPAATSNHWQVVLYCALALNVPFCDGGFNALKPPKEPKI